MAKYQPTISNGRTVTFPLLIRLWHVLRPFLRSRLIVVGFLLLLVVGIAAVFAPMIATHDPAALHLTSKLKAPSNEHWLGTDQFGRDVYSRIIWGARTSLLVGLLAVLFGGSIGTFLGLVSGYAGGAIDAIVNRIVETLLTFPIVLVAIVISGIVGAGTSSVVFALAVAIAPRFTRVVRGQVLSIRGLDYVEAARAVGAGHAHVLTKHVLRNSLSPVIVLVTLYLPYVILVEAALSFLGIGVSPDASTWGRIMADGRQFLQIAPWISTFPGLGLMFTALGFNLIGDGLRDTFDPRQSA